MSVSAEWPTNLPCKIALVGEAPGEEEVRRGRPFVGPSGKVLEQALAAAGLTRSELLITNVFEEKADGNNCEPWLATPGIFQPARARLLAELAKAAPTVVVPLGGSALFALCGHSDVHNTRGTVLSVPEGATYAHILPTYHPAFILRSWKLLVVLVGDLIKAKRLSEDPTIAVPERRLLLDPTLEDLFLATPALLSAPLLSVDIETAWGQITHIGFAWSERDALCVPFVDLRQPNKSYWATPTEELEAWKWVRLILESATPKLGQYYGNYDALYILKKVGIQTRNWREDTALMHHALYPELPKSLAFLGAAYGTQGAWKAMGRRQSGDKEEG